MLYKGPYNSNKTEPEILNYWLKEGFFKPEYHRDKGLQSHSELKIDNRKSFSIINPPPNAYMRPHIGNVSGYAYQDLFLRYNRMLGKKVLGQPGKDHAGIQGEVVVEKIFIENKKKSKQDMGREKFYKAAYEHFVKIMPKVMDDEKRIGLSSDYDRNLFTLDPKIVETVLGTFMKMFDDNMVYKGVRIVNWDPVAKTTLADIDTERDKRTGELVYIAYPLEVPRGDLDIKFEKPNKLITSRLTLETEYTNYAYWADSGEDHYKGPYDSLLIKSGSFDKTHFKQIKRLKTKGMKAGINRVSIKETDLIDSVRVAEFVTHRRNSTPKPDYIYIEKEQTGNTNEICVAIIKLAGLFDLKFDEIKFFDEKLHKIFSDLVTNHIIVATTRAETMLGDTAVAINPNDRRYQTLLGETVSLPLSEGRRIRIIDSPRVDRNFGTGAVKITPAHSYDDFVIINEYDQLDPESKSNALEEIMDYINVIDKDAKMTGPILKKYKGMTTKECRTAIIKDLDKKDLIVHRESHDHSVMIGERSKADIEQIMSSQWFINVKELKDPAIKAVEKGEIKIHPVNMTKIYLHWMENLRDWPVSRSLWWGYRIPVWYKGEIREEVDQNNGRIVETIDGVQINGIEDAVKEGLAKVQIKSPGAGWIQESDVFDTWFSSGQWVYATLKADDLMDSFYPTDIMETSYDILELWVSRMIMLSLYTQGQIPFKSVYLHGLVKAPDGQKMSKSKGNVISPDEIIDKYGADALRLMYIVGNKAGSGYPVSYEKLEGYKRFLNKIWNASKLVLSNIDDNNKKLVDLDFDDIELEKQDKGLIKNLQVLSKKVKKHIEDYRLGLAAELLYQEFWHNFCDICLEEYKQRLYTKDREGNPINTSEKAKRSRLNAQYTLLYGLKTYIQLMHPFIPFITEAIWQELPRSAVESKTIMYSKWPG